MSRFSDAYWRAVRRVEQQDSVRAALAHKQAHQKHITAQRKAQYKTIDAQMKDLRRPSDTPPWEKE